MTSSPTNSPTSSSTKIPGSFYLLLPLGMALSVSMAANASVMVLRTLELAETRPDEVLLLPTMLKYMSPAAVSGAATSFLIFVSGVPGALIAMSSDRFGLRNTIWVSVSVLVCGNLLSAWSRTFFIGIMVSTTSGVVATPVFTAIFASQTDCERTRQKLITIQYGVLACTYLVSTFVAGVQPFWAGYIQAASLLAIGLALEVIVPHRQLEYETSPEQTTLSSFQALNRLQVIGFGVLCVFTVLHSVIIGQFFSSALLVFAKEQLRPIGGFSVPAQWFLSLNSVMDLILAYPIAWFYDNVAHVKYHAKFRLAFVALVLACGLITVATQVSPPGAVPPYVVVFAVALASFSEMHWAPVMITIISSTMPKHMVGAVNSIYFVVAGFGSMAAGFGVPIYAAMGPEHFFFALTCVAGVATLLFHFTIPALDHCLDGAAQSELVPLDPGKQL